MAGYYVISYTLGFRRVGLEARLLEGVGTGKNLNEKVYFSALPVYAHWFPLVRTRDIDPLAIQEQAGTYAYTPGSAEDMRFFLPEQMLDVYAGGGYEPPFNGTPLLRVGVRYVFFPFTYMNGGALPVHVDLHTARHNEEFSVHVSVGLDWERYGPLGHPKPDISRISQ